MVAHELKFGASVVVQSLTQQEMFVKERIGCFSIFKRRLRNKMAQMPIGLAVKYKFEFIFYQLNLFNIF